MSSSRRIKLKSSDSEYFEVDEAAAFMSVTVKNVAEDVNDSTPIFLANVDAKTLALVMEYCNKHSSCSDDEELEKFDAEYLKMDYGRIIDVLHAANYMNIISLMDLTCKFFADSIKDKSPEDVRNMFDIVNDLTGAEVEAIRRDNEWAFSR